MAPDLDLAAVRSALDGIAAICEGSGPSAFINLSQRFGWIAAPKSTMIQPGPVHGGLAEDPAAELARLLDMLIR